MFTIITSGCHDSVVLYADADNVRCVNAKMQYLANIHLILGLYFENMHILRNILSSIFLLTVIYFRFEVCISAFLFESFLFEDTLGQTA